MAPRAETKNTNCMRYSPYSDDDLLTLACQFGAKLLKVATVTGALDDGEPDEVAEDAWHEWAWYEIQQQLAVPADDVPDLNVRAKRLKLPDVFRDAFVAALNGDEEFVPPRTPESN